MYISTEIHSAALQIGEERAIELCARTGFDCWDFTLCPMGILDRQTRELTVSDHPLAGPECLAFARQLKKVGEDNGIFCNQSHAPFPPAHPKIRDMMKQAIACTAEAGGKICVIHPLHLDTPRRNAEFYGELLPFAKQHGVQIATENLLSRPRGSDRYYPAMGSTPESYLALLQAVDDPDFVACLDLGHAEIHAGGSSAVELIRALGPKLQALHIHDNDHHTDQHRLPFTGSIDYLPILQALKQVGYQGQLTMEATEHIRSFGREELPQAMEALARTAMRLRNMLEQC